MAKTKIQKRDEAQARAEREISVRLECGHRHSDEGFANCPAKRHTVSEFVDAFLKN